MLTIKEKLIDIAHDYISNHSRQVTQAMITLSELERELYKNDLESTQIENYLRLIYWRLRQADAASEKLKKNLAKDDV